MRWLPARFPRRPRCRKYTRRWWRLPQRWAGCHAAGGARPRTQVCRHRTPTRGGGSTVGRRSWALAGTKGSCPGSRCPRLPLMCRDFALGKAGRFPRSSRLEPGIQHPGVPARAPASPRAPSTARFPLPCCSWGFGGAAGDAEPPRAPRFLAGMAGRKRLQLAPAVGLFLAGLAPGWGPGWGREARGGRGRLPSGMPRRAAGRRRRSAFIPAASKAACVPNGRPSAGYK